ncbi:MAG: hypothetical protein BWX60_00402 [Candidatus Marinimicrobia bacterium ADurb.Bin030]|nr:MAG: hypothetical protein BWX60_00402 [Candidatus Marinimicrobia bacterium ADurb.Bin030]
MSADRYVNDDIISVGICGGAQISFFNDNINSDQRFTGLGVAYTAADSAAVLPL